MTKTLAILIPVYNGGLMLKETVESCAYASFEASDYEIIVVDNCSTDNALEGLPIKDGNGAKINIFRNNTNLGRIGNWNRAVEIARHMKFKYFTFLFVGDVWIRNGSLKSLINMMDMNQSIMGIAPYQIVTNNGSLLYTAERISVTKKLNYIQSQDFLKKTISNGVLPYGPLQTNVYKTFDDQSFNFTPEDPSHTDLYTIINFLSTHPGVISVVQNPYMAWKIHDKRFHMSMDTMNNLSKDIAFLENVAELLNIDINWKNAHSALLLRYFRSWKENPDMFFQMKKYLKNRPCGLSFIHFIKLLFNKLFLKQSMVRFP